MIFSNPVLRRPQRAGAFFLLIAICAAARLLGAEAAKEFDLPAGAADAALKRFAEQAGTPVVFGTETAARVRTNTVKGSFAPREALARLLDGTGLIVTANERTGGFTVSRDPNAQRAASLPPSAPPASNSAEAADLLVLSPFVVATAKDTGYTATSTLSGTRINTKLEDVATAVQVVTKQFMEDTGSTTAKDVLLFTTGTEVSGTRGNYSAYSPDPNAGNTQINFNATLGTNTASRVRGLLAADNTRAFFGTGVPFDSYNLERIEINRGSNAALFGTGSPAGIINSTLLRPQFRTGGEVQTRIDSWGGFRNSLDVEHALVPGQLAVRIAGLRDDKKFEQEFTFEKDERIYGVVEWRPAFVKKSGFISGATVRVTGEAGRIDANRPRINPPFSNLWRWFEQGKVTNDPRFSNLRAVDRDVYEVALTVRAPALFYSDASSSRIGANGLVGSVAIANLTTGFAGGNGFVPSFGGNPPVFGGGPPVFAFFGTAAPFNSAVSGRNPFTNAVQITDERIFPYRDYQFEGPNKEEHFDFNVYNADLELLFLRNTAGIELSTYAESRKDGSVRGVEQTGSTGMINIDFNSHYLDGRPNPNFGRPFFASVGNSRFTESFGQATRATAFYKLDLQEKIPNWIGRTLGQHVFTGTYTTSKGETFSSDGRDLITGPERAAIPGNRTTVDNNDDSVRQIYYIGPSILNLSSADQVRLSPVTAAYRPWELTAADGGTIHWNDATKRWESPYISYIKNLTDDGIPLPVNASLRRNRLESKAFVWQSHLLADTLVGTLSWRQDRIRSYNNLPIVRGPRNQVLTDAASLRWNNTPALDQTESTFAYGVVAKAPAWLTKRLPGVSRLSVFYNDSENFSPNGARVDALGRPLPPPLGTTEDYGFATSLLDERFSLRVTRYKTTQSYNSLGNAGSLISNVGAIFRDVQTTLNLNRGVIPAAALPRSPGITQAEVNRQSAAFQTSPFPFASQWQFATSAAGNVSFTLPSGTSSTSDLVSEGTEIELTFNPTRRWRITANAARQEAVRTNSAQDVAALVTPLVEQFRDLPVVSTFAGNAGGSFDNNVRANLARTQAADGLSNQEIRKWRVNFANNYTFASDGRLRGWEIGGALRWQSAPVTGNQAFFDAPAALWRVDPTKVFYGKSETRVDAWIGYKRKIAQGRIMWRTQLNIRNLLNDDDLIPVRANSETGAPEVFTIPEPIAFALSTKFSF